MAESICLLCGYEGHPRRTKRGSRTMEIILWTVLLFPGPFYSLWRRVGLPRQCPNCKQNQMVSTNSDAGMVKQREIDAELGLLQPSRIAQPVVISDKTHSTPRATDAPPKRDIDPNAW